MIGSKEGRKNGGDGHAKLLKWVWAGALESRLMKDGQEVGSVEFSRGYGSLAESKSAKGSWTFKRTGFLRPKVTARVAGSRTDYAVMSVNWTGGGTLAVLGGPSFKIRRTGFWRPQLDVYNSSGTRLLSLRINRRSDEGTVALASEVDLSEQDYMLASLAWYVIILTMRYEDDAGTMAAIVAAALG